MDVGISEGRVRRADISDAPGIVDVINTSNYYAYRGIIPKEYFKYPITNYDEIVNDMGRMEFYVFEVKELIVSVAALEPHTQEGLGIVRWVYVNPNYQRRGVGTSLMRCIERRARELGLKKLKLVTHERAYWAINFYGKLGFNVVDIIECKAWRNVIMEKELSDEA